MLVGDGCRDGRWRKGRRGKEAEMGGFGGVGPGINWDIKYKIILIYNNNHKWALI